MNIDMDASNSDEYFVTALQIFDYCGADSSGTLRVDALMDKFAPFVKTNKSEYSHLRSILDPEHDNPEINVSKLAKALNKYSETQKAKVDHDESFNLKSGQAPQDSDSGISTDAGYQLLEDLQCELREKARLARELRSQLEFTDRHHEEALAALSAENEQLRAHLNILREENATLPEVRRDYEEACERLSTCELALADSRRELDSYKKRSKVLHEQVATLENEKLTLQEQLSKSKDECHRINEMYASRQSSLLEQNDSLKTEHADLTARLQDQEEFMQQMIKEKVLLEMELKDLLNKSNHTALRMDHSIDISYTEDQMLTALDSLNSDTRFSQDTASTGTQVEIPCHECVKRNVAAPQKSFRRYLWEPLKSLFQIFAVICFVCAVWLLYGVARRRGGCARAPLAGRWPAAQDLVDLLLRVDYVAEVPM
ncbi:uncharacterized protein LOC106137902 isoform X1 [Amyelois transitella]|uniref:uncharacterized protein LOC106137902 isoform X1 n=1 Tax=Amyelois transitella TaxID=680683 RepID=UPI00067E14D9|nr:uncharacterized protein LOC106137902 isoform X1 [Amyelois transitella]